MLLSEALNLIQAKQREGKLPVTTMDDINCLRGFQTLVPIEDMIVIDNPILPIGFFNIEDSKKVLNYDFKGFDSLVFHTTEDGKCDAGATAVGEFKTFLHLMSMDRARYRARSIVARAEDALDRIGSMDNVLVVLSDSLPCVWSLQDLIPLNVIIIKEPLTMVTLIDKVKAPARVRRMITDGDWEHAVFTITTGSEECDASTFYATPPRSEAAVFFLKDFLVNNTSVVKYRDGLFTLMPPRQ
jgi:hypothetical protein